MLLGASAFTLYLDQRVRTEFEGRRFALPARIYARPLELHAGLRIAQPISRTSCARSATSTPRARTSSAGSRAAASELEIALRPFMFWDGPQPAKRVRVDDRGRGS